MEAPGSRILDDYIAHLRQERYAPDTIRGYRWLVGSVLRALSTDEADGLGLSPDPVHFSEAERRYLLDVVWRGSSPRSVNQSLSIYRGFLRHHGNRFLDGCRVPAPQDMRVHVDWLEPDQASQVERTASGMGAIVVHLELRLGLRRKEVSRLLLQDIDWRGRGSITVRGKGRGGPKLRTVPFHHRTRAALEHWLGEREAIMMDAMTELTVPEPEHLLIYRHMGRLSHPKRTALDNILVKVSHDAGFHFSHHTLRRTFGRMHWLAGTRPEVISTLMGHRDVSQTLDYIGIRLDDMGDAMDRMREFEERSN